ncbi:hypothetical protein EG327_004582 [Venturia inaequalis]|uniref:HAD-like protein n=1 Tax=Venturia inaequalis TaxID=5025 RepID=A0A8H3VDG7_VENIN|nr:hypothetical protein EG327_004582 [Venturia inaequalis]
MASSKPPKVILFDIGGVCVLSPLAAIHTYESTHSIPTGYINHTISATSPSGSWQKAERGEIALDEAFFELFRRELENKRRWEEYWGKILKLADGEDGKDAVLPKGYVRGSAIPPVPHIDAKVLFWSMMRMARRPDPNIFPAVMRLRGEGRFIVGALSNTISFPENIRDEKGDLFVSGIDKGEIYALTRYPFLAHSDSDSTPTSTHNADTDNGSESEERQEIPPLFDIFISSAHIGMRKPEPRIYDFALRELQRVGRERGIVIEAGDVLFLDDIGQNLKVARERGFRTIKVGLGGSRGALGELEGVVGMRLRGGGVGRL